MAKMISSFNPAPSPTSQPENPGLTYKNSNNSSFYSRSNTRSMFPNWTRVQLIDLLINAGIELRYESSIPYNSLRKQAEEVNLA